MGEEPTTTDPQNATLNGTDPTTATVTTATGATSGTTTKEPTLTELQAQVQRMEAALKKANSDAKTHRLENEQLKTFKEQIEASQLSEQQKQDLAAKKLQEQLATLQKERDDAISGRQQERLNYAIQIQATKQGLNPEAASRLLDRSTLEFDDAGNATNLDTAFKAMVKQFDLKPVAGAPTSGGTTNPSRSQTSAPQELSWEVIAELQKNPEEYNRRNANGEISRWIAGHPVRYGQSLR